MSVLSAPAGGVICDVAKRLLPGAVCTAGPHNTVLLSAAAASCEDLAARLARALADALSYPGLVVALVPGTLQSAKLPHPDSATWVYKCPGVPDNALVVTTTTRGPGGDAGAGEWRHFALLGRARAGFVILRRSEAARSRRSVQMMVGGLMRDGCGQRFYETLGPHLAIERLAREIIAQSALMVMQFRDVPATRDDRAAKDQTGELVRYVLVWDLDLPASVLADIQLGVRPLIAGQPAHAFDSVGAVKKALEAHYHRMRHASPNITQQEVLRSVPAIWELCELGMHMASVMPGPPGQPEGRAGALVYTSGNKGVHVMACDPEGYRKLHTIDYKDRDQKCGQQLTDFASAYLLARAPGLVGRYRSEEHPDRAIHNIHGGIALRSGGARKSTGLLPTMLDAEGLASRAFVTAEGEKPPSLQKLADANAAFFHWVVENAPSLQDAAPLAPPAPGCAGAAPVGKRKRNTPINSARLARVLTEWERRYRVGPASQKQKQTEAYRRCLRFSVQTPQFRNHEYAAGAAQTEMILLGACERYLEALHRPPSEGAVPPELHNVPLNERYRRYDGAPMRFAVDVDGVPLGDRQLAAIAEFVDGMVSPYGCNEGDFACTAMMVLEPTKRPSGGKAHLVWPGVVLPQAHLAAFGKKLQLLCDTAPAGLFPKEISDLVDANIYSGLLRLYCCAKPDRDGVEGELLHGCYVLRRVFAPRRLVCSPRLAAALVAADLIPAPNRFPSGGEPVDLDDALYARRDRAPALVELHRFCALTPTVGQPVTMLTALLDEERAALARQEKRLVQVCADAMNGTGGAGAYATHTVTVPRDVPAGTEAFACSAAAALLCQSLLADAPAKRRLCDVGALKAKRKDVDGQTRFFVDVVALGGWSSCEIKGGDHSSSCVFCVVVCTADGQAHVQQHCHNATCKAKHWEERYALAPRHGCVRAN
jgi:hypothetical protein